MSTQDAAYLEEGLTVARTIEEADDRARALSSLVRAAGEMKFWKKAYALAKLMPSDYRVLGYTWILRLWDRRNKAISKRKNL